jgi:hypothetical protein
MTAVVTRRRAPSWLAPTVLALAVVAALAAVLLLARRAAAPDVPPEPAPFQAPEPARPMSALDVIQASDGRLALSDGSRDVAFRPDARIEVLQPATATQIRPGAWLAVIGVPNEVRNFAVRSLVIIDAAAAPDGEGVVRSPAGFAGHEAARDQAERPIVGGVVERVDGQRVTLGGPTGPITVDLTPAAPLRRLVQGQAGDIHEGDRIAFAAGRPAADAPAVLVLPGGAR